MNLPKKSDESDLSPVAAITRSHPPAEVRATVERILLEVSGRLETMMSLAGQGHLGEEVRASIQAQMADLAEIRELLGSGADPVKLAERAMSLSLRTFVDAQTLRDAASATSAQTAEAALHLASEAARREVTSFVQDFYEKKIFAPYLRFASAEDEEAYRKREAERERAIKEALALGTPEGALRALELSKEQMLDAKAHGAGDSPEYATRWDSLEASGRELTAASAASKSAGQRDTPTVDPLNAVEPTANVSPDLIAAFKRTGVVVADQSQEGHGVTARDSSPQKRGLT